MPAVALLKHPSPLALRYSEPGSGFGNGLVLLAVASFPFSPSGANAMRAGVAVAAAAVTQQYIFIHHCILHAIESLTREHTATMTTATMMSTELHQNPVFEDDDIIVESDF
ncbi:unnamed protein product [Heligmosomoides polygyrus]|uniref:Uncharacterized protein n=1 Tax=Heligmosomoides polygyrus TaxID=6339 RepID=A0A183FJE1_HELPZ|nr:unnamed protein product [Heligmosomoides polygyrus]